MEFMAHPSQCVCATFFLFFVNSLNPWSHLLTPYFHAKPPDADGSFYKPFKPLLTLPISPSIPLHPTCLHFSLLFADVGFLLTPVFLLSPSLRVTPTPNSSFFHRNVLNHSNSLNAEQHFMCYSLCHLKDPYNEFPLPMFTLQTVCVSSLLLLAPFLRKWSPKHAAREIRPLPRESVFEKGGQTSIGQTFLSYLNRPIRFNFLASLAT